MILKHECIHLLKFIKMIELVEHCCHITFEKYAEVLASNGDVNDLQSGCAE